MLAVVMHVWMNEMVYCFKLTDIEGIGHACEDI